MKVRPEGDSLFTAPLSSNAGTDTWPSALADLSTDARSYLETQNAFLTTYNIELGYDYWTAGSLDTRPHECLTQVVTPYRGDFARNFSGGTPGKALPLDFRIWGIWVDLFLISLTSTVEFDRYVI